MTQQDKSRTAFEAQTNLPPLPEPEEPTRENLEAFIRRAGFTWGWSELELWARCMAERAVTELKAIKQRGEPVDHSEILCGLFRNLDGVDSNQPGYHHACGWNDALRRAVDVLRANAVPQPAEPVEQHGEPVAYLDIGTGDYLDLGSDLDDDDLLKLPPGRHPLYMNMALTQQNLMAAINALGIDSRCDLPDYVLSDAIWARIHGQKHDALPAPQPAEPEKASDDLAIAGIMHEVDRFHDNNHATIRMDIEGRIRALLAESVRQRDGWVAIPRGLIAAACSAIDKKRDAPKTLAELRRYNTGNLAPQPAESVKATADMAIPMSDDEIDIDDVRQYLEQRGCLAHLGVRALLAHYGVMKSLSPEDKLAPPEQ